MGTYIWITGNLKVKKENEPKAVQAVRELNKIDDLKRGGSSRGEKWFSWLPENYEDKINDISDIIGGLHGWDIQKKDLGDEIEYEFSYSDKWGQHEVFFVAMAPFLEELQVDHTCDELEYEDQKWSLVLNKETKKLHQLIPKVTITYPELSDDNVVTFDSYMPYSYNSDGDE